MSTFQVAGLRHLQADMVAAPPRMVCMVCGRQIPLPPRPYRPSSAPAPARMGQQLAAPLGTGVLHFVRRVSICARCELPRRLSSSDYGSRRRAPTPQPHLYANVLFGAPRGSLSHNRKELDTAAWAVATFVLEHDLRNTVIGIFSDNSVTCKYFQRGGRYWNLSYAAARIQQWLWTMRRIRVILYWIPGADQWLADTWSRTYRHMGEWILNRQVFEEHAAPFGRPPAHARSLRERAHDTVPAVHQPLPGRSMRSRC